MQQNLPELTRSPELTQSPELTLPELSLAFVQTQSCLHAEVLGWSARQLCHALPAAGLRLATVHTACFLLVESKKKMQEKKKRKKKRRKKKSRRKKKKKNTSVTCLMLTRCSWQCLAL